MGRRLNNRPIPFSGSRGEADWRAEPPASGAKRTLYPRRAPERFGA